MSSSEDAILYWLAAARAHNVGPAKFRQWLEIFGSLKEIFSAPTQELSSAGLQAKDIAALQQINWRAVEKDRLWCEQSHCHLLCWDDEAYPRLLHEINDPPLVLFIKGNPALLCEPQLAIVGSRNPTSCGRELAENFAAALSVAGLTITSGLALGIDAASHRGALSVRGQTIAVIGSGLDCIYPTSHKKLAETLFTEGAVISEFPPEMLPHAKNFPRRNRIISGLSLGVLVIEAAMKSGSLITARLAINQGREVFAIPGSIHNPLARGCHALIRQGAKLVEEAKDVLEEIEMLFTVSQEHLARSIPSEPIDLVKKEREFLKHVGYHATPLDSVLQRSGLTAGEVSSMLLSLELRGYVECVSGGYVRCSPGGAQGK